MASGVFSNMVMTTNNRKNNHMMGSFSICDTVQSVEKTPMINSTKTGDNKRESAGVEASKNEIDIYRNKI